MERVLDELDNHEVHLRRLARRIDSLKASAGEQELRVVRLLHVALEQMHAAWGDDAPPGYPDSSTTMITRVRVQREAIESLARQVEDLGGAIVPDEIHRDLDQGRQRMPFALEGKFHEVPLVVPPDVMERDFHELIFNPQQEALLKIDHAVDQLERRRPGPAAPA